MKKKDNKRDRRKKEKLKGMNIEGGKEKKWGGGGGRKKNKGVGKR